AGTINSSVSTTGFAIFPNPTTGVFTIALSNLKAPQVDIEVLTANGGVILRKTAKVTGTSMRTEVNLGSRTPGLYFVKVTSAGVSNMGKIIVQR
ncbi:MAG: T9SS type A sorting domain-containing protein, partial [Chitinophagaceae bacterium]